MVWFKVDDGLAFHPKTLRAGNAAMGLWVRAGAYCAQHLTDGFVSDEILPSLGTVKQAQALVAAGLWERAERAWRFHEWNADGRQPTRESVEAERAATRDRVRKHREAKAAQRGTDTVSNAVGNAVTNGRRTDVPTRPDPTISTSNEVDTPQPPKGGNGRGQRLNEHWTPDAELIAQMRSECPNVDLKAEHRVFVDYWIAQPGVKGRKTDWSATWRNWMRRKQADHAGKRLTPSERAMQTAAAGLQVADRLVTTLNPKEIEQ